MLSAVSRAETSPPRRRLNSFSYSIGCESLSGRSPVSPAYEPVSANRRSDSASISSSRRPSHPIGASAGGSRSRVASTIAIEANAIGWEPRTHAPR